MKSGLKVSLNYKHWAVALALGVVVSASGQETKKKFSERYNDKNCQSNGWRPSASANGLFLIRQLIWVKHT